MARHVNGASPTQRAIAAHLNLSPARIVALRRAGMPCASLEGAASWYSTNVRPRVKPALHAAPPCAPSDGARELAAVERLSVVAAVALQAGHFELVRAELQAAMRTVPMEARHLVMVNAAVLAELCGPILVAMSELATDSSQAAALTDSEADAMGHFWYCIACRENFPTEWLDAEPSAN